MSRQVRTSFLRVFLRWANRERRPSSVSGDNDPAERPGSSYPHIGGHLPGARLHINKELEGSRSSRSPGRRYTGLAPHLILRQHTAEGIRGVCEQTPDRQRAAWPVALKNRT